MMYDVSGAKQRLPSLPTAQKQHPKHSLECCLRICISLYPLTAFFNLFNCPAEIAEMAEIFR
jgi:hypothetical protein